MLSQTARKHALAAWGELMALRPGFAPKTAPRPDFGSQVRQHEAVSCAHTDCLRKAVLRYRVNGALVNLCRTHYDQHTLSDAREYCGAQGLLRAAGESRQDWLARMSDFARARPLGRGGPVGNVAPVAERVPGEDD